MNPLLPTEHLTAQELLIVQDAWARLNEWVLDLRTSGKAGAVIVRINLKPDDKGGPALVRGRRFTIEAE